jgi:hypothetical protein
MIPEDHRMRECILELERTGPPQSTERLPGQQL